MSDNKRLGMSIAYLLVLIIFSFIFYNIGMSENIEKEEIKEARIIEAIEHTERLGGIILASNCSNFQDIANEYQKLANKLHDIKARK